MRRLFLNPERLAESPVTIAGADFHHLARVLRVREGDRLALLDGEGRGYEAELLEVGRRVALARIIGPLELAPEPALRIIAAQAVGKGERFEQVIQHGTEVGIAGFIPLMTERTVVRLAAKDVAARMERWRGVAKGAAEQCGRPSIPRIEPPMTIGAFAAQIEPGPLTLILDPAGEPLHALLEPAGPPESVLLAAGPEGGFSPAELELLAAAGGRAASLGPYVLRTETAALVAAGQLLYHAGMAGR